MIPVLCVIVTSLILLVISCTLYLNGYKQAGINLRNAVYGSILMYSVLVVSIGLWG